MNNTELEEKLTKYIQKESYDILISFHNICKENNLSYILDYGTLLGAVRHQGFIPWDDDVDVSMPRGDYEKFVSIMLDKETKGKSELVLQNNETDPHYYFPFSKMRLSKDHLRELSMSHFDITHGPWIDIFVFDDMPMDRSVFNKNVQKINSQRKFIDYITPVIYENSEPNQYMIKTLIKRIIINLSKNKNKLFYKHLDMKYSSLVKSIEDAKAAGDPNSNKLVSYAFKIQDDTDLLSNTIYRESFKKRKLVKFENHEFYIPENYDLVLRERYGNYNDLPPKDQRKSNHRWDMEKLKEKNIEINKV